jgi:hypothetical protein
LRTIQFQSDALVRFFFFVCGADATGDRLSPVCVVSFRTRNRRHRGATEFLSVWDCLADSGGAAYREHRINLRVDRVFLPPQPPHSFIVTMAALASAYDLNLPIILCVFTSGSVVMISHLAAPPPSLKAT